MGRRIRWFSSGAASAVAAKIDISEFGLADGCVVQSCTGSEDDDNHRFRRDAAAWLGCDVAVIKSETYSDTWSVWEKRRYLSGFNGAPCTGELKVVPRLNFQLPSDVHIFGYTADPLDRNRAENLRRRYPDLNVYFPLVERGITKANCLAMIERAGIALPRSYAMGFPNANCLKSGCSKATSPDYWALHRKHFPDGFARTAALARELGVKLAIIAREKDESGKVKNIRGFIDEIPADQPTTNPIAPACDLLCAMHDDELYGDDQ